MIAKGEPAVVTKAELPAAPKIVTTVNIATLSVTQ
jgi:hypothetical protein